MTRCSECGGSITITVHDVYSLDGSRSGMYNCMKCGRKKSWSEKGMGEQTIDMSEVKSEH